MAKPKAKETPDQGQLEECDVHGKPVLSLSKVIELSREKGVLRCPLCASII